MAALVGLIVVAAGVVGKSTPLDNYFSIALNLQWVATFAQVLIWSVCFHDGLVQQSDNYSMGASWILTLVAFLLAVPVAIVAPEGVTKGPAPTPETNSQATGPQQVV